MKTLWGRQVLDLQTWFDIACGGLTEDAQNSIAREVNDHYDQAYAAAIEEGAYSVDANEQALQSLGDPYRARKGFRQVHLLKWEVRRLYPPRLLLLLGAACVVLIWVLIWIMIAIEPQNAGLLGPVVITGLVGRLWLKGQQPTSRVIAYHAIWACTLFLAASFVATSRAIAVLVLFYLLLIAVFCQTDLHLQRKLRRTARKA